MRGLRPGQLRLLRRAALVAVALGTLGALSYVSERKQAQACEQRVRLLGARAPEWRNPSGAGMCAGESRRQALTLVEVLERHPALPKVRVRVESGLMGRSAQVELGSGDILAPPEDAALRDQAVWIHELGHVQSMGKRPSEPIAQRLLRAIEEGAADYYAASLTGSGTLGVVEGRAQRDLGRSLTLLPTEWSALALGAADPHLFGWALASQMWSRLGPNPVVAADLLRGLAAFDAERTRGAFVVRELIEVIPESSREVIEVNLLAWLPEELRPRAHAENSN